MAEEKPTPSTGSSISQENKTPTTYEQEHGDLEQPNQTIDNKQQSKNLHHQPNLDSASSSVSMEEKNLDSCSEDDPSGELKGKEEKIYDVENQELPSLQTKQEQINRLLDIHQDLFKAFDIKQRDVRSFQQVIDNALLCSLELGQQQAKLSEMEEVEATEKMAEDERQQQRSLGEVTKEFFDVIQELQKSVVFFRDKVDKGAALEQAKQQKREVEALFDEFVRIASASTSSSERTP